MVINQSDKKQFLQIMLGAGEIYSREITKPLLQIYFSILEPYSIDQVSSAFFKHFKALDQSSTFFPKPADIIKHIVGTKKEQIDSLMWEAEQAWQRIEKEIPIIGSYGTIQLEDKNAREALRLIGGWRSLCMSETDQMKWMKKDFLQHYVDSGTRQKNQMLISQPSPSNMPELANLNRS